MATSVKEFFDKRVPAELAKNPDKAKDVPAGALAISRVEQKHVEGYADKVADRYASRRPVKPVKAAKGG